MTVAYPAGEGQPPHAVINISTQVLPFADLLWIAEGEIVCAGYVRLDSYEACSSSANLISGL